MFKLSRIIYITAALAVTAFSAGGAGKSDCPSVKCTCDTSEIASRIEVKVVCNGDLHNGYVPVLRQFTKPISALYLDRSELSNLDNDTFISLSYVREMYLNDNRLTSIDAQSFHGIDLYMEILDLQHNSLTDLAFLKTHNFQNLRELSLRDNELSVLSMDSFAFLMSLESLVLDDNRLAGPLAFLQQPSLMSLTHLNLDANRLTSIDPTDFTKLNNLQSLLVNRNSLTNLNFLADQKFSRIQGLGASGNRINSVPASLLQDKRLLKWLDLSNNILSEANFTTSCGLKNLEEIYLSHNQLTYLPDDAFRATSSLTIFTIANNRLTSLPGCALSHFYHRMDTFDIGNNPIRCDCSLKWLHTSRSIMTERHSQCSNIEFASTDSFDTQECLLDKSVCVKDETCPRSFKVLYAGISDNDHSEYIYSTPMSGGNKPTAGGWLVIFVYLLSTTIWTTL